MLLEQRKDVIVLARSDRLSVSQPSRMSHVIHTFFEDKQRN